MTNPWFSPRDLNPDAPMRLFCLPHAGSGAAAFYRWKRQLAEHSIAVCPVLLPGREARLAEASFTSADALIADLLAHSDPLRETPYAIFGHSMGALLAYRWAAALIAAGYPAPHSLIVSGRDAPQTVYAHAHLHRLADEPFIAELATRYGGVPPGFLDDPDLRELFLPILRADLTLVETFKPTLAPPLPCPLLALAGTDDQTVTPAGLAAWAPLTASTFRQHRLPGDHFYNLGPAQPALLQLIAAQLAT